MNTLVGSNPTLRVLEEILRQRICPVCVDRKPDGSCEEDCTLFQKLPQVAAAISRVSSDRMDEYVSAIRREICEHCAQQINGECTARDEVRCVLDRYLPLIVNIIEETQAATSQCGTLAPEQ